MSELRATRQALERVETRMGEDGDDGHNGRADGRQQGHERTDADHQREPIGLGPIGPYSEYE